MKKLKYLLLILVIITYSCNGKKKEPINESLDSNLNNTKMDLADKGRLAMDDPNKDDIILALEKAIDFFETANREQFRKYLGAGKEQINSVSDDEFINIKEDNSFMKKNIIIALRNDEATFEILSNENNIFEISFSEKGNDSLTVVMNFSYNKDRVLVLDRLNTL